MHTGVSMQQQQAAEPRSWKLLLWTALAGLLFGLVQFGEIAEDTLRAARNSRHWHKASGDIVLIKIDDRALRDVGRLPWPRRYHAELTDALTRAGAKRIFFDVVFSSRTNPSDDRALAEAFRRSGRVHLASMAKFGPNQGVQQDDVPLPMFAKHAQLGSISVEYNYQNAVWRMPYASMIDGRRTPSVSVQLAGRETSGGDFYIPDYSLDPQSVPSISAAALLDGKDHSAELRGKDVIIGTTTDAGNDKFYLPGTGKMGGVYLHVLGAETLKMGTPIYLGWLPAYALGLIVCALAVWCKDPKKQTALLAAGVFTTALGPALLEARLITLDVTPGLFVLLTISAAMTWRRFRARGFVNPISDLPNLNALRANRNVRDRTLIAARVLNYEEIVATLPASSERKLVEQIISRLTVGAPSRVLYQGDGGIFAWFEEPRQPFGNHLEALYALFRNPARVGGLQIDLTIAFGVEVGSGRSPANRLSSALVAAEEAAHDGLKWKFHDPESLENASWKLSMLSQLDDAIDKGEVWVAYQPKLELGTRRIIGAEALARWTHPEKGPIAASAFVAAAEQHNRIGKLTDFVLEKAVAAAAQLNRRVLAFDIAVNLSARLLTDKVFTLRVSALLARNGLDPRHLTLELTETAALTGNGDGLD